MAKILLTGGSSFSGLWIAQALADALDAWLQDAGRRGELLETFTDMHRQLRQDTASRAAEAILPYLRVRV